MATTAMSEQRPLSPSDSKPTARIVDPKANPLDDTPRLTNFCPFCGQTSYVWHRCHIVGKGQRGDDVPENLAWACAACHDCLHRRTIGSHGLAYGLIAERLRRYCRFTVPELGAYADAKKYRGWLEAPTAVRTGCREALTGDARDSCLPGPGGYQSRGRPLGPNGGRGPD